ncbi:MAG: mmgE/PrpD family protein [Herminiimonas sp.]|nr:mmgE/PrpD family protein [Herminiimonas sp.]
MSEEMNGGGRSVLSILAEKISTFDISRVSGRAMTQAKHCILDTLGVTLAGSREACTQILLRTPGVATAPGPCLILGSSRTTSALDAALVNGTASHALDYDDICGDFGGHHSVPIVPMLLALAQDRGGSGRQFLTAYIVGVETEIRLARAVHPHHYNKGWHPTSTLGVFGAAAAASRFLGLNAHRTAMALAIAGSMAGGLKASFGTMTKPLHVGHCARDALLATLLAEGDFDGSMQIFEHPQGFLNVYNGSGTFDVGAMMQGWGEQLEIEGESIGLKQFPCCGSTHAAITAALKLVKQHGIIASNVARIEILPNANRLKHTNKPWPASSLDAKFSVQYVVARAIASGNVRLEDFEGDAYLDPVVQNLLGITQARPHPEMGSDGPQWGAEVVITMIDGSVHVERINNLVSRDGSYPMTASELKEKFENCSLRVLEAVLVEGLFERVQALELIDDIQELSLWLRNKADT